MRDLNFVNSPLGVSSFVPSKKEWVMEALAGASALSSIIGGGLASKAAKEQRDMLKAQKAADDAGFMYKKNVNYVDTAAGQKLVNRWDNMVKKRLNQVGGAAKVGGATDAAVQMEKDSVNNATADMYGNLAANDTARQDRADEQKRINDRAYTQQMAGIEAQRAQGITQAAQGMSNAMMAAAGAVEQANTSKVDLNGPDNNSKPVEQPSQKPTITAPNAVTKATTGEIPDSEWEHFRKAVGQG